MRCTFLMLCRPVGLKLADCWPINSTGTGEGVELMGQALWPGFWGLGGGANPFFKGMESQALIVRGEI